ncbi:MAG: hypothetical protein U9O65_08580, partial [Thermotogota bacterium]|nr:hypothetical protein [Thermotogota bacterium]
MAYKENIEGFVRVPTAEDPNKVYATGIGGRPMDDPAMLMEYTGKKTIEEAFKEVQLKTPEEARKLGIRLPGTEALFAGQPKELTADMLREGSLNLPGEKSFDSDKAVDSTSWLEVQKSKMDLAEKEAKEALEKQTAAEEERDKWYQKLLKKEEKTPSMAEMLQEQYDKYGITGDVAKQRTLIDEADVIRQNIIDIKAEKDQKLLIEEGKSTSTAYIQGQKALIERQYNSRLAAESARLTAKTATIQALQGQITQARSLSNEMVNAMVWDYQRDRDMMKEFIDYNSDLISDLGDDYKDAISDQYEALESAYEEKKAEAEEKRDLMFAAVKYGVTLPDLTDMTIDEAREAYQEVVAPVIRKQLAEKETYAPTQYEKEWNAAGGQAGTGMSLGDYIMKRTGVGGEDDVKATLFDNIMQSAINEGASSSEAALAAAQYAENNGISLTKDERAGLVSRASSMTPIATPGKDIRVGTGEVLTLGEISPETEYLTKSPDDIKRERARQSAIDKG